MTARRLEGAGPVFAVRGPSTLPAWLWLAAAFFVVYGATIEQTQPEEKSFWQKLFHRGSG